MFYLQAFEFPTCLAPLHAMHFYEVCVFCLRMSLLFKVLHYRFWLSLMGQPMLNVGLKGDTSFI